MIKMHVELGDLLRVSLGPEVPHDSLKKENQPFCQITDTQNCQLIKRNTLAFRAPDKTLKGSSSKWISPTNPHFNHRSCRLSAREILLYHLSCPYRDALNNLVISISHAFSVLCVLRVWEVSFSHCQRLLVPIRAHSATSKAAGIHQREQEGCSSLQGGTTGMLHALKHPRASGSRSGSAKLR